MTRSPHNAEIVAGLGAEPIVCDVYDQAALTGAVVRFAPEVILHELTDLPDDPASLAAARPRNARIRVEGTRNLAAAAGASGSPRIVAQSVAWELPPGPGADAVAELERIVLGLNGVVLRYGQFYGAGTYHPDAVPDEPRVHIDTAAERTVAALDAPSGIQIVVD